MPLTVWNEHGPGYRSETFFARIATALTRADHSAIYIVPNLVWKTRAESVCLPHCGGILFGERIVTLNHWVEQVAAASAPCISPVLRSQIIIKLMSELSLDYFRGGKANELVAQGITAALAAGISPVELKQLAADFGQEREHDLAVIYEAYLKYLSQSHRVDTAQMPMLAAQALAKHCKLAHTRFIIDLGNEPPAIVWEILRTLNNHNAAPDLHVIIPEFLQHEAEGQLGIAARAISPEEWVATTPPVPQLYRAPNISTEYQWAASHLRTLQCSTAADTIGVLHCESDPTFWEEACMTAALIPTHAPAHSLAASPISAPFHHDDTWGRAPDSATIIDWAQWWQMQLAPPDRIQTLTQQLPHSDHAGRTLQDIALWEEIWMRCRAIMPSEQRLTQRELQNLVTPMLQKRAGRMDMTSAYTDITLNSHIGNQLAHLVVLDATQDLLPRITPSPFFKLAASFPQDLNAQRLMAAFPSSEKLIQSQMAVWQRLRGCSHMITGIYSQSSDSRGEVFPSLFFEASVQDISNPEEVVADVVSSQRTHFLTKADTISHVRTRLRDHIFSITELETFAACPFRHFAHYILGIMIPDEETPEIPAKDEGQIIHRILEHYYRTPLDNLAIMTEDERRLAIHTQLATILTRDIRTTTPLHRIQIDRLLTRGTATILHDLAEINRQGVDALQPAHLEWKFGYDDIPPLTLRNATGQSVAVRGKVDRIDAHPTQKRLLLIDYKNRATDPIIGEIQKGQHLQIPLYLMAVQKLFSDHVILGGLLYDLPNLERRHGVAHKDEAEFLGVPGRPKSLVKPEAWDKLLESAAEYTLQYATQIRSAEIPITPHSCTYCDWNDLLPWEEQS